MTEAERGRRVAIILAAGEGKRMKSDLPKVLHPIGGRPLIRHVVETAAAAGFARQVLVVGHGREKVEVALADCSLEFALQAEQLGTGHAVEMAAPALGGFTGEVAVLCGDVPLLSIETLNALIGYHEAGHYAATVLTMRPDDPHGYGRVYRDPGGDVEKIVEQRDLPPGESHPVEVNSGTYCYHWPSLRPLLRELKTDNEQGEYYLTDTIAMLRAKGERVGGYLTEDAIEVSGINNPDQLAALDAIWRSRNPGHEAGSSEPEGR